MLNILFNVLNSIEHSLKIFRTKVIIKVCILYYVKLLLLELNK